MNEQEIRNKAISDTLCAIHNYIFYAENHEKAKNEIASICYNFSMGSKTIEYSNLKDFIDKRNEK